MKKIISSFAMAALLAGAFSSCTKAKLDEANIDGMTQADRGLVSAAGFNGNWASKNADGTFNVEGDILLSKTELQEMGGVASQHELVIAGEEHYRTTNVVSLPATGQRNITVRLGSGFPSYYSPALDAALARYNNLNLRIKFTRVSTGGNIVVTGANLGNATSQGCTLGQAGGFPTGGNPSAGFTLSTNSCATSYLNTQAKADEVIAHEIGHCIGFRHTDYMNRSSCGQNINEGSAGVGVIYIPGTVGTVTGSYNSWMMACTNGNPAFSSVDGVALNYVY
jgi:hypothetical protein